MGSFVTSISLSSSETLEFDDVIGAVLYEETRKRSNSNTSTSEAMMVRGRSKEKRFIRKKTLGQNPKGRRVS